MRRTDTGRSGRRALPSQPTAAIVVSPELDDTELATRIANVISTALGAVVR